MAKPAESYDYTTKIITLGDSEVGKTCLLVRYCQDKFTTETAPTVGIDYFLKNIEIDKKKIKIQFWDTTGQEKYRAIAPTFIKKAMGIILSYSVGSRESFQHVEDWMKQIKANADTNVRIILVATKSDLVEQRAVEAAEGERLAGMYGIKFFETSARNGTNVEEAFLTLSKDVKEHILDKEAKKNQGKGKDVTSKGEKLKKNSDKKKEKCC